MGGTVVSYARDLQRYFLREAVLLTALPSISLRRRYFSKEPFMRKDPGQFVSPSFQG